MLVGDVFVCHATENRLVAEAAVVALEARGHRCWIAPRDVPPGTDYAAAILSGISGSRLLLLVFSRQAIESAHVPREVERAVHRGIPIIPFRLDDMEPSGPLEYFISGAQWLDATTGRPEDHLPALVDAVEALLAPGGPVSGAKTFSDEVRTVLADVIFRYGTDLTGDPRRLQAVLRDMVGEHRAEISALVVAAEEGVPESLLQSSDVRATMGRLAQRLQDYRALGEAAAWWAVEGWASALRLTVAPEKAKIEPTGDAVETVPVVEESPEKPLPKETTEVPDAPQPRIDDPGPETVSPPASATPYPVPEPAEPSPLDEPVASPTVPTAPKSEPADSPSPSDAAPAAASAPVAAPAPPAQPPPAKQDHTGGAGKPPPRGRRRWLAGLAFVAVLVIGVLTVVFLSGNDKTPVGDTADPSQTTTPQATTPPTTRSGGGAAADGDLHGSSVVVFDSNLTDEETGAIADVFGTFTEETGIDVAYTNVPNLGAEIWSIVAAGDQPDIVLLPQPGVVADLALQGSLVALPDDVVRSVAAQWPTDWMAFGNVDGRQFAIPTDSDVKSLVWYKPARFANLGYEVPQTWDELRLLTDRAVSDGNTPWCIGIESGLATGWVFTDWVEDLTLRFHSDEYYDKWVEHEVPFNSPEMAAVWQEILDVWTTPGAVYGGAASITSTWFFDNAGLLADNRCLMHRQASFLGPSFPAGGDEIDVFYFPSLGDDRPVVVSGTMAAAFRDAPEVWAVMEYLGSADYAEERQQAQAGRTDGELSGFLTANTAVDRGIFSRLEQSFLDILRFGEPARFDASDDMPTAVGAGTFWTEATRAINGEISVQEALEIIEASWP